MFGILLHMAAYYFVVLYILTLIALQHLEFQVNVTYFIFELLLFFVEAFQLREESLLGVRHVRLFLTLLLRFRHQAFERLLQLCSSFISSLVLRLWLLPHLRRCLLPCLSPSFLLLSLKTATHLLVPLLTVCRSQE